MHGVVHLAKLYTIIYNVSVVIVVHDVLKVALHGGISSSGL